MFFKMRFAFTIILNRENIMTQEIDIKRKSTYRKLSPAVPKVDIPELNLGLSFESLTLGDELPDNKEMNEQSQRSEVSRQSSEKSRTVLHQFAMKGLEENPLAGKESKSNSFGTYSLLTKDVMPISKHKINQSLSQSELLSNKSRKVELRNSDYQPSEPVVKKNNKRKQREDVGVRNGKRLK